MIQFHDSVLMLFQRWKYTVCRYQYRTAMPLLFRAAFLSLDETYFAIL